VSEGLAARWTRLASTDRVIGVVFRPQNPRNRIQADVAILRKAGFHIRSDEAAGAWLVLVLERDRPDRAPADY
jgi:hypothetical protein